MNNEHYNSILEDLESILIECEFTHRFSVIEGYHQIGKRILTESSEEEINNLVEKVAKDLKIRKSKIQKCVLFAKLFQNLSDLPEGKNITWNKINYKYLTNKEKEELPALPDDVRLKSIIQSNVDWIVENKRQNEKGINLFLPYEKLL